jgi:hypothetical protein
VATGETVEALRRGVNEARVQVLEREADGRDGGPERDAAERADGPDDGALAAVRHAVLGPGKRVRPLLLLGAHRAAGGSPSEAAAELACSVELVHAYSLVHDDLPCMDDDVLRRGEPTLHVRFGADVATLARDGQQLDQAGYEAIAVQPIDMMPQTYHVHTVSLWKHQG